MPKGVYERKPKIVTTTEPVQLTGREIARKRELSLLGDAELAKVIMRFDARGRGEIIAMGRDEMMNRIVVAERERRLSGVR